MSSTLMWKPSGNAVGHLPDELKRAISRKLWDTDGSCGGDVATVGAGDIDYLQGLQDGGVEGAAELIELIEKHGEVDLWHKY
jgi:hypothetical protein